MRAAVFSDTHRNTRLMAEAIRRCQPDLVIHLGDHADDAEEVSLDFPDIPFSIVRGNCDFGSDAPDWDVVSLGPVKAFLCHGHLYNVKFLGPSHLVYAALEHGASIALFGHTHVAMEERMGDVLVINPGTAGKGRDLSWALLEVRDDGQIFCSLNEL